MAIELSQVLRSALTNAWRRRWLWWLGIPVAGGQSGIFTLELFLYLLGAVLFVVGAVLAGLHVPPVVIGVVLVALGLAGLLLLLLVASAAEAGMIWAGLQLDLGVQPGLIESWRQGWARKWRFAGISLVRVVLFVIPLLPVVTAFIGFIVVTGTPSGARQNPPSGSFFLLFFLIFAAELLAMLLIYAGFLVFGWAPALGVVADMSPIRAFKGSWRMFRGHMLDSLVIFLIVTFALPVLSYGVMLVAVVVSAPGIILVVIGFSAPVIPLGVLGVVWIASLGLLSLLLGTGLLGAIEQITYALACRQLAVHDGLVAAFAQGPED